MTKKLTFGVRFDDELRERAKNTKGFIRFIDNEYFEVAVDPPKEHDFVYFKRNNNEKVLVTDINNVK